MIFDVIQEGLEEHKGLLLLPVFFRGEGKNPILTPCYQNIFPLLSRAKTTTSTLVINGLLVA